MCRIFGVFYMDLMFKGMSEYSIVCSDPRHGSFIQFIAANIQLYQDNHESLSRDKG